MPRFLCWQEAYCGPDDATGHDAPDARTAAERHAEWYDSRALEYPPEREVSVRSDSGTVEVFVVTMRAVPEYSARPKRRK